MPTAIWLTLWGESRHIRWLFNAGACKERSRPNNLCLELSLSFSFASVFSSLNCLHQLIQLAELLIYHYHQRSSSRITGLTNRSSYQSFPCPAYLLSTHCLLFFEHTFATLSESRSTSVSQNLRHMHQTVTIKHAYNMHRILNVPVGSEFTLDILVA